MGTSVAAAWWHFASDENILNLRLGKNKCLALREKNHMAYTLYPTTCIYIPYSSCIVRRRSRSNGIVYIMYVYIAAEIKYMILLRGLFILFGGFFSPYRLHAAARPRCKWQAIKIDPRPPDFAHKYCVNRGAYY